MKILSKIVILSVMTSGVFGASAVPPERPETVRSVQSTLTKSQQQDFMTYLEGLMTEESTLRASILGHKKQTLKVVQPLQRQMLECNAVIQDLQKPRTTNTSADPEAADAAIYAQIASLRQQADKISESIGVIQFQSTTLITELQTQLLAVEGALDAADDAWKLFEKRKRISPVLADILASISPEGKRAAAALSARKAGPPPVMAVVDSATSDDAAASSRVTRQLRVRKVRRGLWTALAFQGQARKSAAAAVKADASTGSAGFGGAASASVMSGFDAKAAEIAALSAQRDAMLATLSPARRAEFAARLAAGGSGKSLETSDSPVVGASAGAGLAVTTGASAGASAAPSAAAAENSAACDAWFNGLVEKAHTPLAAAVDAARRGSVTSPNNKKTA